MHPSESPSPTARDTAANAAAGPAVIHLPAELGVESAADLHRELLAHVDDTAPVVLDASDVARIHTAALQLFCLFVRDRRDEGRLTRWEAPSVALQNAAALLGVTALLNMAQEARA